MAYSHKNSKGNTYYLNSKEVTLKGDRKQRIYYFSKDIKPDGVCTWTLSPALRPINALPKGDSSEMYPMAGSASTLLTILYSSGVADPSSITVTFAPRATV